MSWFMLKCQDIDQFTEEGQCECQITYFHRDLLNFLGQPLNNRVMRGLGPDLLSLPGHRLHSHHCCLLMLSSLSGSRRPWRGQVTRDKDTWHVTRDDVSWGASPSVPPVQEVPRARGRGAAGPGHPAPPAQWPARHRTLLRLKKYWKF